MFRGHTKQIKGSGAWLRRQVAASLRRKAGDVRGSAPLTAGPYRGLIGNLPFHWLTKISSVS